MPRDYSTSSPPKPARPPALLPDDEIRAIEKDIYGVRYFALTLVSAIAEAPASSGFVIAVNAKWGTGKSSFIEMIRLLIGDVGRKIVETAAPAAYGFDAATYSASDVVRRLEQVQRRAIQIIDFNPWRMPSENSALDTLFEGLFKKLDLSLKERTQRTGKTVLRKTISVAGSPWGLGQLGDQVLGEENEDQTLSAEWKMVCGKMRASGRLFLVVIDDVDRLEVEEIRRVIRMVKSSRHLPNTVFLLAFDEAIVAKALSGDEDVSHGRQFLQKIVQASFDLPRPTKPVLRNALERDVLETTGHELKPTHDGVGRSNHWNVLYNTFVEPYLVTPRSVKRLVNAASLTWRMAPAGALDIRDHVAIQAIRIFNPALYDWLSERRRDLARRRSERQEMTAPDATDPLFGDVEKCYPLFPRGLAEIAKRTHDDDALTAQLRERKAAGHPYHVESYFRYTPSEDDGVAFRLMDLYKGTITEVESRDILRQAVRTLEGKRYMSGVVGYWSDLNETSKQLRFAEGLATASSGLLELRTPDTVAHAQQLLDSLRTLFDRLDAKDARRLKARLPTL